MTILAVRSIPLNRDTFDAWKSTNDIKFAQRRRNAQIPAPLAVRYEAILNLGNVRLNVDAHVRIYNSPDTIRAVTVPTALRDTLGDHDLLPERNLTGPHWHKRPGFGGRGKTFHEGYNDCHAEDEICLHGNEEVQRHIEGVEYRIITVSDRVVQATRKDRDERSGNFIWRWVGVDGIRRGGFIPTVKRSVANIPGGDYSVLGFDIIHDGNRPWIIEINTCPGVNEATAERIVNAIKNG